jgi:hypothetical protein
MFDFNKPSNGNSLEHVEPERIIPAPLGELVLMPPEYICYSPTYEQSHDNRLIRPEKCEHCVDAYLVGAVEKAILALN